MPSIHRCSHCGRIFSSKALLQRHYKVHTGLKDFVCQICNLAFNRKDNLKRHVIGVHTARTFNVGLISNQQSTFTED